MALMTHRVTRRRRAKENLEHIIGNAKDVLVVHYSCESFYEIPDGRSARITSIAVRHFESAQTTSFSIHQVAEISKVALADIQARYDVLERTMLDGFYDFVRAHAGCSWLHWNMRDVNYGFAALERRYMVLGGNPAAIPDDKKFDLARLLADLYGIGYIGHPRLLRLMEKNKMTKLAFLTGDEEAKAFERKEYVRLHQSTLRKVDTIHSIALRAADGRLRTNSRVADIYGLSPQSLFEFARDHWFGNVVYTLLVIAVTLLIQNLFSRGR